MSTFTGRELEFLASLNESWTRLCRDELVRLLKDESERRYRSGDDDAWPTTAASPWRPAGGSR